MLVFSYSLDSQSTFQNSTENILKKRKLQKNLHLWLPFGRLFSQQAFPTVNLMVSDR